MTHLGRGVCIAAAETMMIFAEGLEQSRATAVRPLDSVARASHFVYTDDSHDGVASTG
jgi:hypothetical protein